MLNSCLKEIKIQPEKTKQTSEPDSDMCHIHRQGLKITMINMVRTPIEKVYNIEEQMDNVNKEMEILWKNQNEMLEIKNTMTEITHISRLAMLSNESVNHICQ